MAVDTSNWTPAALAQYQKTVEQTKNWAPELKQRALDTAAKTADMVSSREKTTQSTTMSNLQKLREDYLARGWNVADIDRKIAEASGTKTALPKMDLPAKLPMPPSATPATPPADAPKADVAQPAQPPAVVATLPTGTEAGAAPSAQPPSKVSVTARAPSSLPDRTRELQVMRLRLEKDAKKIEGDIKDAEKDLQGIPEGIKKSYEKDFADLKANQKDLISNYERVQKSNLDEFNRNKLYAQFASIAETLAFSVLRYHAGLQGMRTGRDVSTGLDFRPTNWAQEIAGLRDELQIKNQQAKQLLDEKLGPVKEAEAAKRKTMEEEMHSRLLAARERLQALRGEKAGKEKEAVGLAETQATLQTRADEALERLQLGWENAQLKADKAVKDVNEKINKEAGKALQKNIESFRKSMEVMAGPNKKSWPAAETNIRTLLAGIGMKPEEIEAELKIAKSKWFSDQVPTKEAADLFNKFSALASQQYLEGAQARTGDVLPDSTSPEVQAAPAAGGVPSIDAIRAERARRAAGK